MVEAEPIVTQVCRPSIDAAPTASPFHDQKNAPPCVHEKRFPRCHPGFSETPPGPTRSASPHLERKIHACRTARECISALWGEHSIANPQVDVDLQKNSENPLTSRALRTTLLHLYSVMYIYSPRTKCSPTGADLSCEKAGFSVSSFRLECYHRRLRVPPPAHSPLAMPTLASTAPDDYAARLAAV